MERLARAHVVVLGLGGVGSFAAEALARAGVGRLTLVDGERVDETNANRQLHALDGEFGRFKAEALAERLRRIAPAAPVRARVRPLRRRRPPSGSCQPGTSYVVDAMDTVVAKLHVIARCLDLGIPVVTALGAARRHRPDRRPGHRPVRDPHRPARQGRPQVPAQAPRHLGHRPARGEGGLVGRGAAPDPVHARATRRASPGPAPARTGSGGATRSATAAWPS